MTYEQRSKLEQMAAGYPDGVANAALTEITRLTTERKALLRVFHAADDLRANYFDQWGDPNAHHYWLEELADAVAAYKSLHTEETR